MKKYNPKSFYYDNSFILGFIGVIFFILLGGRGCGKTFSTQKYCIKRWLKKHEPFCWLRLKEPSVRKLLANNGHDFIDAKLIEMYHLDKYEWKVKSNVIYLDGIEFCRILALSTFYQDKGVALNGKIKTSQLKTTNGLANKRLRSQLQKYNTLVLDEMNSERSEKRTFDIVYALVNQLETLCRLDTDKRVFMLGNTLDEGSDILAQCFKFIPNEYGVYHIKSKRAVIHYIEDSPKYREARKKSIAGILAPDESTFTNKIESDVDLIVKDKKYLSKPPSYVINFGKGRERYLVYGNVITSRKIPAGFDNEISMVPYTPGLSYNKVVVDSIITRVQMRQFNFDMLYTLKKFYRNIRLLKDAK